AMKGRCVPDADGESGTAVDHVRLFPNRSDLRWRYRVHEQILPALRQSGGDVRMADIVIQHVGYVDQAVRNRKLERDLRLLQLENADSPDDPFTLFNLGTSFVHQGRIAEAVAFFRRSLERSHPIDSIVRKIYASLAHCHRKLGQARQALDACRLGRSFYPDDVELLFQESQSRAEQKDLPVAIACGRRALESRDDLHFASVDEGLRGFKTRHNLAMYYQELGQFAEAEAQWQASVAEQPAFVPGWLGLG